MPSVLGCHGSNSLCEAFFLGNLHHEKVRWKAVQAAGGMQSDLYCCKLLINVDCLICKVGVMCWVRLLQS